MTELRSTGPDLSIEIILKMPNEPVLRSQVRRCISSPMLVVDDAITVLVGKGALADERGVIRLTPYGMRLRDFAVHRMIEADRKMSRCRP